MPEQPNDPLHLTGWRSGKVQWTSADGANKAAFILVRLEATRASSLESPDRPVEWVEFMVDPEAAERFAGDLQTHADEISRWGGAAPPIGPV